LNSFLSILTDSMVSLSYTCIIKQFSFADHATDAVLIHVSASSERED